MALNQTVGVLGQSTPAATTLTTIYTAPTNIAASAAVNICNRGTGSVLVRVAVRKGSTTTYLLYDEPLAPAGVSGHSAELRAVVLGPGDLLQAYVGATNVDFSVTGFEQPANFMALDA